MERTYCINRITSFIEINKYCFNTNALIVGIILLTILNHYNAIWGHAACFMLQAISRLEHTQF